MRVMNLFYFLRYCALSFLILVFPVNISYSAQSDVTFEPLEEEIIVTVDDFEDVNALGGWVDIFYPKIDRHTEYEVLTEGTGNKCLSAVSENSASGLYKAVSVDLKEYPYLSWRWKVSKLVEGSNVSKKESDDYAARVYVTFKYDPSTMSFSDRFKYKMAKLIYGNVPSRAVTYYWATNEVVGATNLNAYTDNVAMIAAQSGSRNLDVWVTEKVNVFEGFKGVFNVEPSLVESVAVMTDTDNTGSKASACYDDVYFSK